MKSNFVLLNAQEQALCRYLAKLRHKNARNKNVKNNKIGGQSDEMTDLEGIGGEVAFCKLFNLYPDISIEVRNSKTDKGDAVLNDLVIDVKTTKYKTGRLLAAPWKEPSVDLYALMIGEIDKGYSFKGFMAYSELTKQERLLDLGHGKGYAANQEELELDINNFKLEKSYKS